jgi:hypothetical protein
MVQFLSIVFFPWISSIFVGFFKGPNFYVILYKINLSVYATETANCTENLRQWPT